MEVQDYENVHPIGCYNTIQTKLASPELQQHFCTSD